LGASEFSPATENAVQEAARAASISHAEPPTCLARKLLHVGSIRELVQEFESALGQAPAELQNAWESQLTRWLQSRNPRLVAYASSVVKHEPWNPARWWALHSARVCRPCIFWPRGRCSDDSCDFCHGPGHHKPKRPSHNRRKQRRAYDRTPSPDVSFRGASHDNAYPVPVACMVPAKL
jgi:hypothetical protein